MVRKKLHLGYTPRQWQWTCHTNRKRFTVLVLHRRAGKTELALMELVDKALKCSKDLGLFAYVAPLRNQAKAIAWARIKQICSPLIQTGDCEISEGELTLRFPHNGSIVRLFGADNPDAMRGLRIDYAVLDEVAQMRPEVWHEIIQPALADRLGEAVFIGTVKGVDLFSELYFRALQMMKDGSPDWWVGLWTCYETDAIEPEEIERLKREMSARAFAREMMCDFTAQGDDQLIGLADVQEAATRVYTPSDVYHAPRVIGCDPARFGDDRTVIVRRQGLQVFDPTVLRDADQMQVASRLSWDIEDWQPDAVFIDSGMGVGIIDMLRHMGHTVHEVNFGAKSSKPLEFRNRRTEMWWGVREWLKGGGAIPDLLELKQELATPTYKFNDTGQIVLESKDDIRKRLPDAGSPDVADALALTFAASVKPKKLVPQAAWPQPGIPQPYRKSPRRKEYDPYRRKPR